MRRAAWSECSAPSEAIRFRSSAVRRRAREPPPWRPNILALLRVSTEPFYLALSSIANRRRARCSCINALAARGVMDARISSREGLWATFQRQAVDRGPLLQRPHLPLDQRRRLRVIQELEVHQIDSGRRLDDRLRKGHWRHQLGLRLSLVRGRVELARRRALTAEYVSRFQLLKEVRGSAPLDTAPSLRTYLVDRIFCSSSPLISWLRQMEALETASLARSHTRRRLSLAMLLHFVT
jgi:hypothetical protein